MEWFPLQQSHCVTLCQGRCGHTELTSLTCLTSLSLSSDQNNKKITTAREQFPCGQVNLSSSISAFPSFLPLTAAFNLFWWWCHLVSKGTHHWLSRASLASLPVVYWECTEYRAHKPGWRIKWKALRVQTVPAETMPDHINCCCSNHLQIRRENSNTLCRIISQNVLIHCVSFSLSTSKDDVKYSWTLNSWKPKWYKCGHSAVNETELKGRDTSSEIWLAFSYIFIQIQYSILKRLWLPVTVGAELQPHLQSCTN